MSAILAFCIMACSETQNGPTHEDGGTNKDEYKIADFESEETSPYFFRYGNSGTQIIDLEYKPRWVYSYKISENPKKDKTNPSSNVLECQSMEARNYGIKFSFQSSISASSINNIQFKLFQQENVIGKATWNNNPVAEKQNVCIKLLSEFNTVCDFRQDEGVILDKEIQDFSQTGEWITFNFNFNKELYGSSYEKLKNGVVGIAILPTYNSETTLSENNIHTCYIDDITINAKKENE